MEFLNYEKREDTAEIATIIQRFESGELKDKDKVSVKGTIHRIKEMSGFAFVILRSPRIVFQCLWDAEKSHCDLKDFSVEECVIAEGIIISEERSRLGFDILIETMTRVSGRAAVPPVEIG
ncbi:MAG TPA: hypothetical protein PKN28_03640, partial [Clostridiales bacterium]|nr:hypothetical protein [Clostridiales bacterium]